MKYAAMTHYKQVGFTLIELMVVIVIMGIVMALGIPSFTTWIENGQIRTGAESVLHGLNLARTDALRRNEIVQFRFDPASKATWAICTQDAPATPTFLNCFPTPGNPNNLGTNVIAAQFVAAGAKNAEIRTDTAMGLVSTVLAAGLISDRVTFDGLGRLVQNIGGAPTNNVVRIDIVNPRIDAAKMRRLVVQISIGGQVRVCDPDPGLSPTDPRRCA
jgi:type IV fimbrial biogenesis protein FimT